MCKCKCKYVHARVVCLVAGKFYRGQGSWDLEVKVGNGTSVRV